jgi:hypothetical protein
MDRVRFLPNERIDLVDMEDSAGGALMLDETMRTNAEMWLPSGRAVGAAVTSARILGGFGWTTDSPAGTGFLTRGSGIFPYADGATLKFGLLQGGEGPASKSLDFTSTADGVYSVYVKAVFGSGSYQNRVFWNPSATATEFIDNVASRNEATWDATFQDSSAAAPGIGEWVKTHEITIVSNLITNVDDYRHFFYEGSVPDTYAEEWGDGANDRNDDRTLAPITDHHRFAQAVKRQFADMFNENKPWSDPLIRQATALHINGKARHSKSTAVQARYGTILDASEHTNDVDDAQSLLSVVDGMGSRPYCWETSGRLARPPRLFDDFTMYAPTWTGYATGLPVGYSASRTGTGDAYCPTTKALGAENGVARLTGTGTDTVALWGPQGGFLVDTANGLWRFAARMSMEWTDLDLMIFRIGMAGTTWDLYFEVDNVTHSDNNYYIAGTDAALPVDTTLGADTAVPAGPTPWVLLYLWQINATTVGWAIYQEGEANNADFGTITVSTMAGHAEVLRPYCELQCSSGGGPSYMLVDWWEVWGNEATGMGLEDPTA